MNGGGRVISPELRTLLWAVTTADACEMELGPGQTFTEVPVLPGCVTLGHCLSLSEPPVYVSRFSKGELFSGREVFGCTPGNWQDLGTNRNWGAGRTGFKEMGGRVAEGEALFADSGN